MKKYVKPDLYYENFELSTHIATCAWDMTNSTTREECTAQADPDFMPGIGESLFNNDACDIGGDNYEDYCWTNGSVGTNVFSS